MKSSLFTLLTICFTVLCAHSNSNPWELDRLSENQIIELEGINFEVDQSVLSSDFKVVLEPLKRFLLNNETVVVELQGHTNSLPPDLYCDQLSQQRADSIRDYLIEQGVNPSNLIAKGYGKTIPVALNSTNSGRKSNQRVDVKILSL